MYYGQTNKKIRSFFKALRKAARDEGGAIGYIEEFDAIGGARSGMNSGSMREGIVGVVNELLVQMQSFDLPTGRQKFKASFIDWFNGFLPDDKRRPRPKRTEANILIVASTNRAADLDPALLRPGRFDRVIGFNLPPRADRMAIAQYYLDKKNHDEAVTAALIADLSAGYTPGEDREAARRGADHRAAVQPDLDERHRRAPGPARDRGRRRPRDGVPPRRTSTDRHPRSGARPDRRPHPSRREDGLDPAPVGRARPRRARRRRGAIPQDPVGRPRPDLLSRWPAGPPSCRSTARRAAGSPRTSRLRPTSRRSSSASSGRDPVSSASRRRRSRPRRTWWPRCCPTSRVGRPPRR